MATRTSSEGARLLNRELSWLDYSERVLALAIDPETPLLERVKLCAIFSSNLDEFFQVRVAGLLDQVESGIAVRSADGLTAQETLVLVRERVRGLVSEQSKLWKRELQPELAANGIAVCRIDDCAAGEVAQLERRFEHEVFPVLTPLGVGPGQPFPFISPLSLSLAVLVRDPDAGEERFARVKVPEALPRFLGVGDGLLVPLENVIGHFLPRLFPGMEIAERAAFRVTRDADFEVSDEADDLLEAVQFELRRRRFGDVVRVETAASMSEAILGYVKLGLAAEDSQIYPVEGLLDLADLMQIASLDRPELKDEKWAPRTPRRLAPADAKLDIFHVIGRADILVHHPYESFGASFERFLRSAAADPSVSGLKTSVYRTSADSPVVPALIDAAEAGKQAVCLVELKARFDERRNIEWSQALEQAGVHVVHGFPHLKIHAKTTLVTRRDRNGFARFVHVGTGNYNARTAGLYEDVGLFTDDDEIAADVADLFNYLTGYSKPPPFRKLLVAPFTLRDRLLEEIAAVGAAGPDGRIRIKVNALTDPKVIEALYAASQAGARIDVVARSICALRPGVEGLSPTIRVRSVLGRFLEHSRLFNFSTPERESWFLGSADLMPRNLDHRIEIVAPVEDARARTELASIFETLLSANDSVWELAPDGSWTRLRPGKGERARSPQAAFMRRALIRARRGAEYRGRGR
jgi:polyphosphate kinase